VIGLCFGGGQILLGAIATAVGAAVLWGVKLVEHVMVREFRARLTVTIDPTGGLNDGLREQLRRNGLTIIATTVEIAPDHRIYAYEVLQSRTELDGTVPAFVDALAREPGVRVLCWRPANA
jgi:putative Mg2+ transporter-C (MgtC) family protein